MYKPSPSHQKFLDILTEKNRKGFAIGGGNFYGTNLGTREGFAGVKQFITGDNKGKYYVRYRDKKFGKIPNKAGFKEGNEVFNTKKEADNFYKRRQANLSELKASGQKTKILDQTKEINNFVNNFFDDNISKYNVKDYDKFEKKLIKEFKKSKIQSLGEKGRNIFRHGLPNIGAKDSKVSFDKYNVGNFFSQGENAEQSYKNYFKKLFFSGKLATDKNLRTGINQFLNYELLDKRKNNLKLPKNIDDVLYLVADERTGSGKFRSNIIKKYFPETMDKYIKKKNRSSTIYDQKMKVIESKLTRAQLRKALGGETSIKKFMRKQSEFLKKIFDVSVLEPGLNFNLDHVEGIAEISKMNKPEDIIRGLKNLVGMTSARNYELGWKGFSSKRKGLINNIIEGVDVNENLQNLNKLTSSVYPETKGKNAYKIINNRIVPTQNFRFTYEPEKAFKQFFTEISTTPSGAKALKTQYKTSEGLRKLLLEDPNLRKNVIVDDLVETIPGLTTADKLNKPPATLEREMFEKAADRFKNQKGFIDRELVEDIIKGAKKATGATLKAAGPLAKGLPFSAGIETFFIPGYQEEGYTPKEIATQMLTGGMGIPFKDIQEKAGYVRERGLGSALTDAFNKKMALQNIRPSRGLPEDFGKEPELSRDEKLALKLYYDDAQEIINARRKIQADKYKRLEEMTEFDDEMFRDGAMNGGIMRLLKND